MKKPLRTLLAALALLVFDAAAWLAAGPVVGLAEIAQPCVAAGLDVRSRLAGVMNFRRIWQ